MQLSGSFAEELQYFSGRSCERDSVKSYATSLSQKIRHTSIRTSKRIVIMAQSEGNQGIIGTVRNYIPGMSSPSTDAQATSGSHQGILSYIPGFGGSTVDNEAGTNGEEATSKKTPVDTGKSGSDNPVASERNAEKEPKSTGNNNYSTSYQGAGIGTRYSTGKDTSEGGTQGQAAQSQKDHPKNDTLAETRDNGQQQGSSGNSQQGQESRGDGVRGAPIEGDGVKGYAVSAPVGSGDTNIRSSTGEPSGQVSGAHMQYAPDDKDTRDHTGRGTVEHTHGHGDSNFANVKRNIAYGTEHVVSKSSQSHIEHTSTTQL